jgi:hypothetical protein
LQKLPCQAFLRSWKFTAEHPNFRLFVNILGLLFSPMRLESQQMPSSISLCKYHLDGPAIQGTRKEPGEENVHAKESTMRAF